MLGKVPQERDITKSIWISDSFIIAAWEKKLTISKWMWKRKRERKKVKEEERDRDRKRERERERDREKEIERKRIKR
jgi:hypothetical protein